MPTFDVFLPEPFHSYEHDEKDERLDNWLDISNDFLRPRNLKPNYCAMNLNCPIYDRGTLQPTHVFNSSGIIAGEDLQNYIYYLIQSSFKTSNGNTTIG